MANAGPLERRFSRYLLQVGLALGFLASATACGSGETSPQDTAQAALPQTTPDTAARSLPAAPWSRDTLDSATVPVVFIRAWKNAENRRSCALLAPRSPERSDARARIAQFSGGWGVAYDTPEERSAFGVAGTGTEPSPDMYDDWPYRREWADGSRAGWGPEGGTGPNHLAYLVVAGQRCLYNVWSRAGPEHLGRLLEQLRFVRVD